MPKCSDSALGSSAAGKVDLGLAFSSEVFDAHIVDRGQVFDLILCREQHWASWIEARHLVEILLVALTILTVSDHRVLLRAAIVVELEAGVVTALSSQEKEPCG